MKKIVLALCAISAVTLASPALAAATVTITQPVSGTPDSAQIFGITNATMSTTQFGTEPTNGGAANVTFTGNTGFTINNGFAQLITGSSGLTSLTIDPNALFTDMKLSFSLTGQGNFDSPVTVSYLLGDGTTGILTNAVNGTGNNGNFEIGITGGLFDAITITSTGDHGFAAIKQVSFEPVDGVGAVPEPATWAMMLLGFGAIGASMRRRKPILAQIA